MGEKGSKSENKGRLNSRHKNNVYSNVNELQRPVGPVLKGFNCVYTNADSFLNKIDEFKTRFLSDSDKPEIIGITEVLPKNMKNNLCKSELDLPGYDIFPESFPNYAKRGAVIYAKKNLSAVEVHMESSFSESTWIKVNMKGNDKLLFGCVYKSPSSSEANMKELINVIDKACKLKFTHLIIVGDFNFPDIDWSSWNTNDDMSYSFLECVRDNYLYQVIDQNTRHRDGQKSSLLDLVLVNDCNNVSDIEYLDPLGSSDHNVLTFKYRCYFQFERTDCERLNYYKADYDGIRKELDIDWGSLLQDKGTNDMLELFMNKLNYAINKHIPKSKSKNTKGNVPLSKETVKSIKRKHRMWERYMEVRSEEKYREYCKARNKVKKLTRKERKKMEKQVAESAKSNVKNFWKYVNSKRKSKGGISELHVKTLDGTFIASSDQDKAEVLANFFSSVFTEEDVESIPTVDSSHDTVKNDEPLTQEEVRKLLLALNVTKSPGPDKAHPKLLHELSSIIDFPLFLIYKKSLDTGIVPDAWKIAIITALFKKGDKRLASNYRPVSLTSILCKIMEKIIRKRIIAHMDRFNLFSVNQFGFLNGRSTSLQLLKVLDSWTDILDTGGVIDAIYMDFMKAFDKVPHVRLMKKLRSYGISNKICAWVENFLSDRKQCVQVNGQKSKWHSVTSGIPQGSVLGPVLFVIFINDLPDCVESDVYLFADDTKIYREITSDNDIQGIQNDLNNLFTWSKTWLLKFHPDKCKVLCVSQKSSDVNEYTMRTYDGGVTTLENVSSEKDIGVTIDCNLNFVKHIQTQVNKANQICGLMRRSFLHLDNKTFSLLYKALVRPHVEYASSVWSPYKKKDIETIENVQRRATRMLPQMKNLTYEERLKRLSLPTLKFRRMRGDMIETFKILSGIYDGRVTKGLFQLNTSNVTRGNSLKLMKNRSRKDVRKYSFTFRIVDVWNSLPDPVVTAKTVHQFENRLDKHWKFHPLKFDYTFDYGPSTGSDAVRSNVLKEELPIEDQQVLQAEST